MPPLALRVSKRFQSTGGMNQSLLLFEQSANNVLFYEQNYLFQLMNELIPSAIELIKNSFNQDSEVARKARGSDGVVTEGPTKRKRSCTNRFSVVLYGSSREISTFGNKQTTGPYFPQSLAIGKGRHRNRHQRAAPRKRLFSQYDFVVRKNNNFILTVCLLVPKSGRCRWM
jgi:hypothetical protein